MPAAPAAKKAPPARKTAPAAAEKAAAKTVKPVGPVKSEKAAKAAKPIAKPAAKSPAKPVSKPEPKALKKNDTKEKLKKPKMVRDSFTMPEPEYKVLGDVKRACVKGGIEVKKSELLRVGVALLQKLKPAELQEALAALPPIKAGRPKTAK